MPADHLAQFVVALAREHLDLSEIVASYKSGLGQPPFDPRMMTALLLYAYCSGLYSSRRIAKACTERVDFMMIVAHDAPDFRTIADFRKRHLPALGRLFLQVLKLAEKAGLAKLGHVALEGTKIKANASKHKAMSYDRMKTRETEPRLPGPTWGRPVGHPVARGSGSIAASFAAVDLDMLLPPPGAQLIQIGPELDCDLATFGARASKIIVELLRTCGAWPKTGIVQAVYRGCYVSSSLVARLLIDTMKQIFSQSGSAEAALIIETRPPRPDDLRGDPQPGLPRLAQRSRSKAVIEFVGGAARRQDVSCIKKDVPHGLRYLDVGFADGGAPRPSCWTRGSALGRAARDVTVRYDFRGQCCCPSQASWPP